MINVVAPAKINLFLRICGKNAQGYHLLDSLVAFTKFGDHLTIEPAHKDELVLIGDFASTINTHPKDNLVIRAINAFRQSGGDIGPLRIVLEKKIPVGAGLGGGSSDAATLLLAINERSKTPLSQDDLYGIGLKLGADVPVCLTRSCHRIANIGEILCPHDLPKIDAVLLVNPQVSLSTRDVFTNFSGSGGKCGSGFGGSLSTLGIADLVRLGNDLTKTAYILVPQINHCLNELITATGVIAAAMSGSGTSCFAFFDNKENAMMTAQLLRNQGYWAEVTSIYEPKNKPEALVCE
jgi:4-diphosphocytidyl-2-C-methyl-D-erythritol kinase